MQRIILLFCLWLVACSSPYDMPQVEQTTMPQTAATHTAKPAETEIPQMPQSTPQALTVVGAWNIRECASTSCDVVRVAFDGEQIVPMLDTEKWYRVVDGWINKGCCGKR